MQLFYSCAFVICLPTHTDFKHFQDKKQEYLSNGHYSILYFWIWGLFPSSSINCDADGCNEMIQDLHVQIQVCHTTDLITYTIWEKTCGVSDLIAKWEKMEEYKITSWHAVVTVEDIFCKVTASE